LTPSFSIFEGIIIISIGKVVNNPYNEISFVRISNAWHIFVETSSSDVNLLIQIGERIFIDNEYAVGWDDYDLDFCKFCGLNTNSDPIYQINSLTWSF
jgi:hypothetical protein